MFEQSTSSPEVIARFDELFERHYPYFAQARDPRRCTPIAAIVRLDVGGVLEMVVCLPPNSFVLDRRDGTARKLAATTSSTS